MKIKVDSLMLNLLVILNVLNGTIWELLGLIFIGYYILKEFFNKSNRISEWKILAGMCMAWVIYVCIQCMVLDLDSTSIIRLYGITKTICMPCIVLLCFNSKAKKKDVLATIFPSILMLVAFATMDFLFGTSILSFGGLNYIGAMCILISAYVFKEMPDKYKILRTLFIVLTLIVVLTSGSRSVIIALALALGYIVLTEQNPKKRSRYFSIVAIGALVLLFLAATLGLNYDFDTARGGNTVLTNISRALSVFTSEGRMDQARYDLSTRALAQYEASSELQKMIGSGDNRVHIGMVPVHNCFLEVLLCYGIVGLAYYIVYLILLCRIVIKESLDVKYTILILLIALIFGMVQPFLTTGIVFQMLIGFVFLTCVNKKNIYEFKTKKRVLRRRSVRKRR